MIETLRLMQIADSALPIGSVAHSYGLETVFAEQGLAPDGLAVYIADVMQSLGRQEAWACLMGYRAATADSFTADWQTLNHTIDALKSAHELRSASEKIGRRLLQLVGQLEPTAVLNAAWQTGQTHHAAVFGLIGAELGIDEQTTIAVFLQQMVKTLVSAAQRLQSIGQQQATGIIWRIKPLIEEITAATTPQLPLAYPGLPEMAGLRHPHLTTRLFIS